MPWDGHVTIEISGHAAFGLMLRVPAWARRAELTVDGKPCEATEKNGFLCLPKRGYDGAVLALTFPMEARFMRANRETPNYAGKAALTRGPLVYCLEACDNGPRLWNLSAKPGEVSAEARPELLGGVTALRCDGVREEQAGDVLYTDETPECVDAPLTFVPYYAWGNRGKGEMSVWVRTV